MSLWQVDDLLRPLLIAVTDRRRLEVPILEWAKRVICGGVDIIQLREKDLTEDELRPLAISVMTVLESPGQLQINGHLQLAIELGCGLHLPEAMPSIANPPRPFSRSIHGVESIAGLVTPDFLIAGHLFPTSSKASIPSRGIDWLKSVVQASPYPIVAIGGIDASNAANVIHAGADGVALISALTDTSEPRDRAAEIRSIIDREWTQR
jgi:thiamine-phosphate diphosphorylase